MSADNAADDALERARLMARIAAPLLSASIAHMHPDQVNPDALAEHFSQDIHRVVPLAQILVDALKPRDEAEQSAVNALTAPVAAKLVAHNTDLLSEDSDEFTRLLKPSINVLASFCDRDSARAQIPDSEQPLARGIVAMAPIVGCLSYYAFGKSPAKRLTDTLDVYNRAQDELLALLPHTMRKDAALHASLQEAASGIFAALFDRILNHADLGKDDPNVLFQDLLAQWSKGLSLLGVLLSHSTGAPQQASAAPAKAPAAKERDKGEKLRALRNRRAEEEKSGEDEEGEGGVMGSGGSGSHGVTPDAQPANYNPMSFFKKGGM